MDNLGDWLYIILIAVVGLSSLLSSGRKKKREKQTLDIPPQDREEIDYEQDSAQEDKDFWDTFWETPKTKQQPAPLLPIPPKKATIKTTIKEKVSSPSPFLTGESEIEQAIRKQKPSAIQLEEEIPALVDIEDLHNMEALRKAVVYTEILNRKY